MKPGNTPDKILAVQGYGVQFLTVTESLLAGKPSCMRFNPDMYIRYILTITEIANTCALELKIPDEEVTDQFRIL